MNRFEEHIKTSLENYEVNYNPAHWDDMNTRLGKHEPGKSNTGKVLGIAAGILAAGGLIYFFASGSGNNQPLEKQPMVVAENNIPASSVNQEMPHTNVSAETGSSDESVKTAAANNASSAETGKTSARENEASVGENKEQKETNPENPSGSQAADENKQAKPEPSPAPTAPSLNATFRFNQTPACAGTAVQFTHENPVVPCTYRWDFGDGKTSSEKSPDHVYAKHGTYTVKLKVTGIKEKVSDEKQLTIVVHPQPSVEVDFSATEYVISEINFEAKGNNITEYLWDFDDKQSSKEKNPVHSYTKTGSYNVTLTVKNSFGCTATDRRLVTIESLFPLAPVSFSPNADGKNDTWMPASFAHGDYNFTLTIFDRSGREVFTTSDKSNAWDGAGARAGDVFIWKATVKNKDGKTSSHNGTITIIE